MAFLEDGKLYIKLDSSGETNTGDKFWDDGIAGQIKQILIWRDKYFISGFQIIYERRGKCLISNRHGGTEGNFETITPKKNLTWLSGYYGSYCLDPDIFAAEEDEPWNFGKRIFSLKFGNEEETYGPFGRESGRPFFFRGNNEIVGFHGFSSENATNKYGYISAIGPYIKTEAVGFIGQPSNPNGSVEMFEDENEPYLLSGK